MFSTSIDEPQEIIVADRRGEQLEPADIARQLERALHGLLAQADPEQAAAKHESAADELARRHRLTAFVAGLPRTKQLRLAGAANLLDGQFEPED